MNVTYIVSLFPCWSETFVVREIHALRRRGFRIGICSLTPPREPWLHPSAESLAGHALYPASFGGGVGGIRAWAAWRREAPAAWKLWTTAVLRGPYPDLRTRAKHLASLFLGCGFAHALRSSPPDRIHAHFANHPALAAGVAASILDVPWSFTAHAYDIFVEDALLPLKIGSAAFAAAISRYNMEYLAARCRPEDQGRLALVRCGIDPADFHPGMVREAAPPRIVALGRFDPMKGFSTLLDACAGLRTRGNEFRCFIIGDGAERRALEQKRHSLKLTESVDMPGSMGEADVRRHLAAAAVFAMPCIRTRKGKQDGIPVALMEAMALERAVVASRLSGIPELVTDGISGLLVEPGHAEALADALGRFLACPEDRRRMGSEARRVVLKDFTVETNANRLVSLMSR